MSSVTQRINFLLRNQFNTLPSLQLVPWKPGGHWQKYPFKPSQHVPPLMHGLLAHSSKSVVAKK